MENNQDVQSTQGQQEKIFQRLICEFKKTDPDQQQIRQFMSDLNLEYQSDDFANMDKVLQALSFEFKSFEIRET